MTVRELMLSFRPCKGQNVIIRTTTKTHKTDETSLVFECDDSDEKEHVLGLKVAFFGVNNTGLYIRTE